MKLIDADKLLEWLHKQLEDTYDPHASQVLDYAIGEIEDGTFDPTPPVQPDTPKQGDTVRHKTHGIGIVIDADDYIATVNFDGSLEIPFLHELEVIKDE